VQNAPTFFSARVMLDIAAVKGVEMLGDTYEITVAICSRRSSGRSSGFCRETPSSSTTGWGKLYGKITRAS